MLAPQLAQATCVLVEQAQSVDIPSVGAQGVDAPADQAQLGGQGTTERIVAMRWDLHRTVSHETPPWTFLALCVPAGVVSAHPPFLVDVHWYGGYTGGLMSSSNHNRRFIIVPARRQLRAISIGLVALWIISLLLVAWWSARRAAPELSQLRETHRAEFEELQAARTELSALRQRVATLSRSDEISRRANVELQQGLTEREEEIAQLRADVAFYERLVGSTGERRGLSVHSVRMQPGGEGVWDYSVTVTQNLNRGAMTSGTMRLQVEGVRNGRLVTLGWDELAPSGGEAAAFSFRYFQQLEGSVLLPGDFAPQRVRVELRSDAGNAQQAFPWEATIVSATAVGE